LLSSGTKIIQALKEAQSKYMQFAHPAAASQFSAAFQHYSDTEFIQFILNNRLH
jgi:hypothetical protein